MTTITISKPTQGWRIDNVETPGNGRITLANFATTTVRSGQYEVGLKRPAKGGKVAVEYIYDTSTGVNYEPDQFRVILR